MDFTDFDWVAYDEMPSREELLGLNVRDWLAYGHVFPVKPRRKLSAGSHFKFQLKNRLVRHGPDATNPKPVSFTPNGTTPVRTHTTVRCTVSGVTEPSHDVRNFSRPPY